MGVELKELYTGAVRKVPMQKQVVCDTCNGQVRGGGLKKAKLTLFFFIIRALKKLEPAGLALSATDRV